MKLAIIPITILALFLAGCSPKVTTQKYDLKDKAQFSPINLDVDAGSYVYPHEAAIADFIEAYFRDSGLFYRIDERRLRYPYTINVSYDWEQPMDAKEFTGVMVSSASLLVIPGKVKEVHTLKVEILSGDEVIKEIEYKEDVTTALSWYHNPVEDRKAGVKIMLEKLFSELMNENIIPRESAVPQLGTN